MTSSLSDLVCVHIIPRFYSFSYSNKCNPDSYIDAFMSLMVLSKNLDMNRTSSGYGSVLFKGSHSYTKRREQKPPCMCDSRETKGKTRKEGRKEEQGINRRVRKWERVREGEGESGSSLLYFCRRASEHVKPGQPASSKLMGNARAAVTKVAATDAIISASCRYNAQDSTVRPLDRLSLWTNCVCVCVCSPMLV